LNACDDPSPSGIMSRRTRQPVHAGGLNVGDYFDLTEREANDLSDTDNGLLHAGRYRRIFVDPGATAENIRAGRIGGISAGYLDINRITTIDPAGNSIWRGRLVMFLNTITPGHYGFIQEGGILNCYVNVPVAPDVTILADASRNG